jgi:tRNA(fMet)-specific endonuclease VapC
MRLLDADTLTHLHAGHERVIERLRHCDDPDIGITIVTKAEILRARYDSLLKAADAEQLLRAQARLLRSEQLLGQLAVVTIDVSAAQEFGRLRKRAQLNKIGLVDLLIASMALANQATIVTRNVRHFRRIPNLEVENWVD